MSRGGYRKGAGRKREYQEPVQKVLIGLPESVLQKLDAYAKEHNLSRPKAIALLLEENQIPVKWQPVSEQSANPELKVTQKPKSLKKQKLLEELKALKDSLGH